MSESSTSLTTATVTEWRTLVDLKLQVSPSGGLLALLATEPRNLFVTGRTLEEVFRSMVAFAGDCAEMGKPFAAFEGVKLRDE